MVSDSLTLMIASASSIVMLLNLIIVIEKNKKNKPANTFG